MVPSQLVIGDDLPFSVRNVSSGRDHDPMPAATVTWVVLDTQTRVEVDSGSCTIYDMDTASFEAVVPAASLGLYNAEDNPDGIIPGREYTLKATIEDEDGVKTSKAAILRAVLDPQDQP